MKRVLVVAKGFPPDLGGIETYSREVAHAYAKAGKQVHVLTSHIERPYADTQDFAWFRSVPQPSQSATARAMLRELVQLRLKGYVPDFIHATSWRVAIFARLLWPKTRLAVTVHGKEVFTISPALKRLARMVLSRSDRLVFVSDAIRQKFNAAYPGMEAQTLVAWNGCTEFDSAIRQEREPGAIFTVCRLVERKNIVSAVRAAALLRDQGVDFHYRIAGTGPERTAIDEEITSLGLEGKVEVLGFASEDQLAAEYQRAAIFLHPQIEADNGADIEGFGITIADAMQFGAVPVAGDNGGPRDFIRNGENGFLVESLDLKAISSTLASLLAEPDLAQRLGGRAQQFAREQFSWSSHVAKVEEGLYSA